MKVKKYLTEQGQDLRGDIIQFFYDNPSSTRIKIEDFAQKNEKDVEEVDREIYSLLGMFIREIGKYKDVPDVRFDQLELISGVRKEREHLDNPDLAKWLVKTHLKEKPDYYTRLRKAMLERV